MNTELVIQRQPTFQIATLEANTMWQNLSWNPLYKSTGPLTYNTCFKATYSDAGLYFLIYCEDMAHDCRLEQHDFDNLFEEDVAEVFIQPLEDNPLYLEFEISPLNKELTLLVPQHKGHFKGWLPWDYTNERRIQHIVHHHQENKDWTAEIFIPYILLTGLCSTPPTVGTTWKINVCRIDYSKKEAPTLWSWLPMTSHTFHNLPDFGKLKFA